MKHIDLFEQFLNEAKEIKTADIKPGAQFLFKNNPILIVGLEKVKNFKPTGIRVWSIDYKGWKMLGKDEEMFSDELEDFVEYLNSQGATSMPALKGFNPADYAKEWQMNDNWM